MIRFNISKIAFAAAIFPVLLAQVVISPAAAKAPKPLQVAEREVVKCKRTDEQIRNKKKCAPLARAEPAVGKSNGFFPIPFAAVLATASAASIAVASNSRNCGNGNNSGTGNGNGGQNNGNCPASP